MPNENLKSVWAVCCPFLFGSIGAAVDLSLIQPRTVIVSFFIIMIGEGFRFWAVVAVTSTPGSNFTFKEKAFMGFAWSPKATVQAAVGSMVLDRAR